MAGTITLCLTQRPDAAGGKLHWYRAGTVSTPQNAYYDSDLQEPLPNPYTLDEDGNIPFFFLADGSIKITLIDQHGNRLLNVDNIPVIGSSSGSSGGGTVDPTTVWQTGDLKLRYGTGSHTGFVRANGRTLGSATSGATERANSDTQDLWMFLYGVDASLSVSGGRGVSAAADWAANKTIALPDWRGRVIAGLDDMGNSAAGRLTASFFGTAATVLGAAGGAESKTLLLANLPAYTPSGILSLSTSVSTSVTTNIIDPLHAHNVPLPEQGNTIGSPVVDHLMAGQNTNPSTTLNVATASAATGITASSSATSTATTTGTFTGDGQGGTSAAFDKTQPTKLATIYIKL